MGDWTKGPYISSRSKWTEDGEYDFCISAGGKVIAETFGRVAEGEEGLRPAEANAHLFAAALDMLAALQKIAAIEDKMVGGDWDEIEEAREIASAAIAKAEGKAP